MHSFLFYFTDTATTEIYTLSLHDALPIFAELEMEEVDAPVEEVKTQLEENPIIDEDADCFAELIENNDEQSVDDDLSAERSEEHTSELQSRPHLVCRLLLEKKKKKRKNIK